jgi:thiamine kinase-like enzyme
MSDINPSHDDMIRQLPCWTGLIDIEPLHGGLSNENHLVRDSNGRFVVRFGHDYPFHHVDRAREIMTARAAYAAGFSPEVHYASPGVMVSEFVDGKTYDANDVRKNAGRIAGLMTRFHTQMPAHVSGAGFMFWVFHVIRDYARTLSKVRGPWSDKLAGYLALNAELEAAQVPLPIIFGHNDLLPANFIDDGTKLWLIDFEYAGFSTAMFDIAGVAANADMDSEQAQELLIGYFEDGLVSKDILRSFAAMQCAATLREAMWAMVSQVHLSTPGVDFDAYAAENLVRLSRALEHYRKVIL